MTNITWADMQGKTWGELAGAMCNHAVELIENDQGILEAAPCRQDHNVPAIDDPYIVEVGVKLDAMQAEIEMLKARVTQLEAPRAIPEEVIRRTFKRGTGA